MIVRKVLSDTCGTCYKFHMWQKGGEIFCHGVEGEVEKVEDDGDIDPDYKDNYDHGDDWDPEELLVNSGEEEESNNKEEDIDGYITSERATPPSYC